jgi:hypothetical protein
MARVPKYLRDMGFRKPTKSEKAYFRKNYPEYYRGKKTTRMGKVFRTKKGILGCYKYVNGKRVSFVRKYRR